MKCKHNISELRNQYPDETEIEGWFDSLEYEDQGELVAEFEAMVPSWQDFLRETMAARRFKSWHLV